MSSVSISLGLQTLTWVLDGPKGTVRNGKAVVEKINLTLISADIPQGKHYLGVHIYPDDTAELVFSESMPSPSSRGEKIYKENHLYGR